MILRRTPSAALLLLLLVSLAAAADPGHDAIDISAGTFEAGDYTFPNQLTVDADFIVNTTTLFVDSTTARVGVGTDAPTQALTVRSSDREVARFVGTATAAALQVYRDSSDTLPTNAALIEFGTTGDAQLWYLGVDRGVSGSNDFYIHDGQTSESLLVGQWNTGRVGIGTASPTQRLDVSGSINISDASGRLYTPEICLDGDCRAVWPGGASITGSGTADYLARWTNATHAVASSIFDNGTHIGIGTATPGAPFEIVTGTTSLTGAGAAGAATITGATTGSGAPATVLSLVAGNRTDGNGPSILFRTDNASGNPIAAIVGNSIASTSGGLSFYVAESGFLTERLHIDQFGHVGISTSGPNHGLHVNDTALIEGQFFVYNDALISGGDLTIQRSPTAVLNLSSDAAESISGVAQGMIVFDGQDSSSGGLAATRISSVPEMAWNSTHATTALVLETTDLISTGVQERLRISGDGNIGIGTSTPGQRLDVNGSINISDASGKLYTPEICLNGDCQTSWPAGGGVSGISGSGTADYLARWTNSTNIVAGNIYDNGTHVGIGTATPQAAVHIAATNNTELRLQGTTAESRSRIVFEEASQGVNAAIVYDGARNDILIEGYEDGTLTTPLVRIARDAPNQMYFGADASYTRSGDQYLFTAPTNNRLRIAATGGEYDSYITFSTDAEVATQLEWSIGLDDSDEDKLKFAIGDGLSASPVLTITNQSRIGIGTTTPTQSLDVSGSINISDASGVLYTPEICLNGDCQTIWPGSIWTDSNGNATFTTGRVGIGTTTPAQELDVVGNIALSGNIVIGSTTLSETDLDALDDGAITLGVETSGTYDTTPDVVVGTVDSGEITNSTILEEDLSATNSPTDNFLLSFDESSGGFTWVQGLSGSGAATRIAFWDSTYGLTSDTNLYWDSTDDYLGIRTQTPGYHLDVNGTAIIRSNLTVGVQTTELGPASSATSITGEASATTGWTNSGLATFASSSTYADTGTYSIRMTADTSNDYAYTTFSTTPGERYSVSYAVRVDGTHTVRAFAGNSSLNSGYGFQNHSANAWTPGGFTFTATGTTAYLHFIEYDATQTADWYVDSVTVHQLQPALITQGMVGIGTSDPQYDLDIHGNLRTTGSKIGFLGDIAENAGPEALERGDLVSISYDGISGLLEGGNIPVFRVTKTTPETALDVVGVVYEKLPSERGYAASSGAAIQAGDRMQIATQNSISFLKASTENGPIAPGDYLAPSSTPGVAMKADADSIVLLGRALEALPTGQQTISAFVSVTTKEGLADINKQRLERLKEVPAALQRLGIQKPTVSETQRLRTTGTDSGLHALEQRLAALEAARSQPAIQQTPTGLVVTLR